MVNFTCKPDWDMGCPDICSNILVMPMRVFLDEIKIPAGRLKKHIVLP